MPRRLSWLVSLPLILAGCTGQEPPARAALPDVAAIVEPPEPCSLVVGDGLGVDVKEVVAGSPAEGAIEVGDRIVTLDGTDLTTVDDLFLVMESKAPGDRIEIALVRADQPNEVSIELAADPDSPERPIMGVLVGTAYQRVLPAELAGDPSVTGRLARLVEVEEELFVLDPVSGHWSNLATSAPDEGYQTLKGGLLVLEEAGTDQAALRLLPDASVRITGSAAAPERLLGPVGDIVAVLALTDGGSTGSDPVYSILGVETATGRVQWEWEVPADLGGVPRYAVTSPERRRILVVATPGDQFADSRHVVLDDRGEVAVDQDRLGPLTGNPVFGWFSSRTLFFQEPDGDLALFDLVEDEVRPISLPASITIDDQTRLWTVGDGKNVLVANRRTLVRANLVDGGEVRVLAERCQVTTDNPGYGV
jgi:hypothetical protein